MIVRRFVESEVEIAFPTQMIYLTGDARRKLRVNMQQEERGDA